VKRRCLPGIGGLNYPMLEEYDFRGDRNTPDLNVSGKTSCKEGEHGGGKKRGLTSWHLLHGRRQCLCTHVAMHMLAAGGAEASRQAAPLPGEVAQQDVWQRASQVSMSQGNTTATGPL
jgi:hypothetical protein